MTDPKSAGESGELSTERLAELRAIAEASRGKSWTSPAAVAFRDTVTPSGFLRLLDALAASTLAEPEHDGASAANAPMPDYQDGEERSAYLLGFAHGQRAAPVSPTPPAEVREIIDGLRDDHKMARVWSGSKFLAWESMSAAERSEAAGQLYQWLCSLGNSLDWYADKLSTLPALAQSDGAQGGWRGIDSAPKDGTPIIAASFGRYGFLERAWWQPEFEAWITSCRQVVMAPGYTVDGETSKLHNLRTVKPTHWMPLPPPPNPTEGA